MGIQDELNDYDRKRRHCLFMGLVFIIIAIAVMALPMSCGCQAMGVQGDVTGENPVITYVSPGITFWQFVIYNAIVVAVFIGLLYGIWKVFEYKIIKPKFWGKEK